MSGKMQRGKLFFMLAVVAGAVAAVLFATQAQPAALTSDLALRQAELRQQGRQLQFTVHTASPLDLESLETLPDTERGDARYVCLELEPDEDASGGGSVVRICPGPGGMAGVAASGEPGREVAVEGQATGGEGRAFSVSMASLNLGPNPYRFRFTSSDGGCSGDPGDECVDRLPGDGWSEFELRTPTMASCEGVAGEKFRSGPRGAKQVALTFDDGPGPSTREILEILRGKRATGTFFLLGNSVRMDPEATRRIVTQGSEVASHSMRHDALPDSADLRETNSVIESATGFRPCSFRPPYGQVDTALVKRAAEEGMNTVLWDVDTEDWTSWATVDTVVDGAREDSEPGSIILMHDGGDDRRSKTIEALPRMIDELRAEGFSFVTVAELLGNEVEWQFREDPDLP